MSPRRARAVRVSPVTRSIRRVFAESAATLLAVFAREIDSLERMSRLLVSTLARRRTVFFAAEAQQLATELVVRFVRNRGALPAMALGADGSMLTAAGNDLGFDRVFARQIEALGRPGDLLVAMTTSGRSPNMIQAVRAARARGVQVIGMTGEAGKAFARRCDAALVVPSLKTARIQEMHLLVGHILCERAEEIAGRRRPKQARRRPKQARRRPKRGRR